MVLSRRSAPLFGHCVATPSSRCESTLTLRCRVCTLAGSQTEGGKHTLALAPLLQPKK